MDQSLHPLPEPGTATQPRFRSYTSFPAIEQAVEQVLGPNGKLVLPERHQLSFVRFLPWIALAFLPIHFIGLLVLLGVTAVATVFGSGSIMSALLSAAVLVLDVIALPGLFKRTRRGWEFFTYAATLGAISNLLGLSLFGLLMSAAVLWLAFQVKYQYR
jgi:hypothetical protein